MKLGISRPRRGPYVPRPIDGKATKQARTRHAEGVARVHAAFGWGKRKGGIPAPGQRVLVKLDPAAARAQRKRNASWLTFRTSRGGKLRIRRGVRVGQSAQSSVHKDIETLNRRERRAATVVDDRIVPTQMQSVTAAMRTRKRKAARKARKANR